MKERSLKVLPENVIRPQPLQSKPRRIISAGRSIVKSRLNDRRRTAPHDRVDDQNESRRREGLRCNTVNERAGLKRYCREDARSVLV